MGLSLLALPCALSAQRGGSFSAELNYNVGIPAGGLKDAVSKTSGRGGEIAFMYGLTDRMAVGFTAGMQDFYQKYPRTVLREGGSDVSAVISNSIQTMPIMAKGTMYLSPMGNIQPFVSLAAGGNFIQYRKFYGEFVDSRYSFGFAAQPSAGLHIPFGRSRRSGFHIAAGFNFMPYKYNEVNGLHHGVVKAGLSVPLQ